MIFFNKNKNANTNNTTTEIELHQAIEKDNSIILELIKANQKNNDNIIVSIRDLSNKIDANYLNQQKQLESISNEFDKKYNRLNEQVIENKIKIEMIEKENNKKEGK